MRLRFSRAQRATWLAALAGSLLAVGCGRSELPDLGVVPDFSLTERSEHPVTATDLTGSVWVVNFFFTSCPDVCPTLSRQMARLQRELPAERTDVRFLSIAVDPERDTPARLRTYADELSATPQWWFVTGPRAVIGTLLRDGFKLAWADGGPTTAPITHSDRFVLLDRERHIRGYYHGLEAEDLSRLSRDAVALAAATAP